jgi:hypothetical protein
MLENHVQIVSYVISSIILVLSGDSIIRELVIPFIKDFVKGMHPIWSALIGTLIFILWCYFGALLVGNLILNTNIINSDNVDAIAILGFIILTIILNIKYQMGW